MFSIGCKKHLPKWHKFMPKWHKQQIAYSEALALGRYAAKLSREKRLEIRKIDDEAYGKVNSYHVSILEEVFSL